MVIASVGRCSRIDLWSFEGTPASRGYASVGRCSQPSGPAGTPASRFGVRQLDSVRQLREITCPVRPIKGRARARPRVQWSYLPDTCTQAEPGARV